MIPVIQVIDSTVLFFPQPIVQSMTLYRVLYLSPVKVCVRLKVICVSEFSLNSKPWFPPGGGLHETLSIGKVKLGPIQFTFSTGAASAHSKTHPMQYYLTFIWIKTFKTISNELHQTKEIHDYCICILKVDMSVRAGKLHNYTAQEIATQRWRLQMAFFIQFCFKTMFNRL